MEKETPNCKIDVWGASNSLLLWTLFWKIAQTDIFATAITNISAFAIKHELKLS